jgi:hypothetical protein
VDGLKIKNQVTVFSSGSPVIAMKDNTRTTWETEKEYIIMRLEIGIEVIGLMGKWPVMVFLCGLLETDTRWDVHQCRVIIHCDNWHLTEHHNNHYRMSVGTIQKWQEKWNGQNVFRQW